MNGTGGALPNQNNSACSSSLPQRHPAGLRACWVVSFSASGTPSAHTPLPPSPALSASPPFPRPSFTHPPQGDPLSSLLLKPPPLSQLPDATANPPFSPCVLLDGKKHHPPSCPHFPSSSPLSLGFFPKESPLPAPLLPRIPRRGILFRRYCSSLRLSRNFPMRPQTLPFPPFVLPEEENRSPPHSLRPYPRPPLFLGFSQRNALFLTVLYPLSSHPSPTHPPQGDPLSPLLLIPPPPSQLPDATANLPSFSLSITLGNLLFASSVSPSFSPPPHKAQAFLLRPSRRRSPSSSRLFLTPFLVPSFSCVSSLRSFTHPPQGGSSFFFSLSFT